MEPSVAFSYKWEPESIRLVDRLALLLTQRGINCLRDKKDLRYRESIAEFVRRIGQGRAVIAVISDSYLKSYYCMSELVEAYKFKDSESRVFPIILPDAHIYDTKAMSYSDYWIDARNHMEARYKLLDEPRKALWVTRMDSIDTIRKCIDGILAVLSDRKSLTAQEHELSQFSVLLDSIEQALGRREIDKGKIELNTFASICKNNSLLSRAQLDFVKQDDTGYEHCAPLNEEFRLRIKSQLTGYLTLILRGSSGKLRLAIPNKYCNVSHIIANRDYYFPGDLLPLPLLPGSIKAFKFGASGTESAFAIVSSRPLIDEKSSDLDHRDTLFGRLDEPLLRRLIEAAETMPNTCATWVAIDVN